MEDTTPHMLPAFESAWWLAAAILGLGIVLWTTRKSHLPLLLGLLFASLFSLADTLVTAVLFTSFARLSTSTAGVVPRATAAKMLYAITSGLLGAHDVTVLPLAYVLLATTAIALAIDITANRRPTGAFQRPLPTLPRWSRAIFAFAAFASIAGFVVGRIEPRGSDISSDDEGWLVLDERIRGHGTLVMDTVRVADEPVGMARACIDLARSLRAYDEANLTLIEIAEHKLPTTSGPTSTVSCVELSSLCASSAIASRDGFDASARRVMVDTACEWPGFQRWLARAGDVAKRFQEQVCDLGK